MARKITTHVLCDRCLHEDDAEVEAQETPPVTIGQMKPRVLALCERHMKDYETFKSLVQDLGQSVEGTAPASVSPPRRRRRNDGTAPGSGTFPCPDPDCPKHSDPFRHEQSLRNHARNVHGVTVPQLLALHGEGEEESQDYLPLEEGTAREPKVKEAPCPECDTVYTWPKNARPTQALGVHRAKVHGYVGENKKRKARGA